MRTLAKIAATFGVVGAIAVGSAAPAAAWYGYYHHPYYHHYYGYYPLAIFTAILRASSLLQRDGG